MPLGDHFHTQGIWFLRHPSFPVSLDFFFCKSFKSFTLIWTISLPLWLYLPLESFSCRLLFFQRAHWKPSTLCLHTLDLSKPLFVNINLVVTGENACSRSPQLHDRSQTDSDSISGRIVSLKSARQDQAAAGGAGYYLNSILRWGRSDMQTTQLAASQVVVPAMKRKIKRISF